MKNKVGGTFLTNAFHLTAPEIANLYKNRWQIELFFKWLKQLSMTEDYKPTDNAIAERVNGIIKQEWLYRIKRPRDLEDARNIINDIIDFYNNKRPHMSNGMMTPKRKRESYTKVA